MSNNPCPTCGRLGVWICSRANCGQEKENKEERRQWMEAALGYTGPPIEDLKNENDVSY